MRTDLSHLPAVKQRDLGRALVIVRDEFEKALVTYGGRDRGRILKVILYGSHARGNWVDEPHRGKGYQSDFDLLIIVNHPELTDFAYWEGVNDRLLDEFWLNKSLHAPVNFIVHTMEEIETGLSEGRYFFADVAKEGVALYESEPSELPPAQPLTPKKALAMAEEYAEEWWPSGASFLKGFHFYMSEKDRKKAAFLLHQATEYLYHCVLLVMTFYTPHSHNLVFLRRHSEYLDLRLREAWPRATRKDRARFEKLKEAYVKARYSKHYRITEEELKWLGDCVSDLSQRVYTLCRERIAELELAAKRK